MNGTTMGYQEARAAQTYTRYCDTKGGRYLRESLFPTLLHDVADRGDEEAAKILVEAGIHPWTLLYRTLPFVYASAGGHEAVVRYPLYDAVDLWRREALHLQTTCEKWSKPNQPLEDSRRRWALREGLRYAASNSHVIIVKLLCHHVSVSEVSAKEIPFTSSAAEGGSIEI